MENKIEVKTCVLVVSNGKLLLLKEWSNNKKGYYWNVVKGTYDHFGETLFELAKREAQEETGLEIELTDFLNCIGRFGENKTSLYFCLIAKPLSERLTLTSRKEQRMRGENIKKLAFFSKEEVEKMKVEKFVSNVVFDAIQQWLDGRAYPLEVLSQKKL